MVLPMHYNSNPMATGTFAQFAEAMKGSSVKVLQMTEGQIMAIPKE
jgi:L-ascorbate metabolism protein UlaG (beta-lactamase superfamily)